MTGTAQTIRGGARRSTRTCRPGLSTSCLLAAAVLLLPAAAHEASAQEREPGADGAAGEWAFVGSDAGNTRSSAAATLSAVAPL